jgi:hypothetical protein
METAYLPPKANAQLEVGTEAQQPIPATSVAKLASICSILRHLGIDRSECLEDLYTALAYILRGAPAQYFEGAAVIASQRRQHPDVLVDIMGEDGFRAVIEYLNANTCNKRLLAELLVDIVEAEEFSDEARRIIIKILPKLTCEQVKALIIASLLVPPGGEKLGGN